MKIPAGTQSGAIFRLKGKGMPELRGDGVGDELVKVDRRHTAGRSRIANAR